MGETRVMDPAHAATIKAARYQKKFEDKGEEYSALAACTAWLALRGFTVGKIQGRYPVAVMLGNATLGQWTKLDAEARDELNGIVFACSGDFRRGAVIVCLNSRVSEKVVDAFLAEPVPA